MVPHHRGPTGYALAPQSFTGRYCVHSLVCCFIYGFLRKLVILENNFGPAGTRLVETITNTFDFTEEPGKLAILERAARTADTIAALEAEAATQSLTAKGSMGQAVINPLVAEARAQTSLLDKLLKSLGLPDTDEATAARAEQRQRRAKKAAQTRWGNRS